MATICTKQFETIVDGMILTFNPGDELTGRPAKVAASIGACKTEKSRRAPKPEAEDQREE